MLSIVQHRLPDGYCCGQSDCGYSKTQEVDVKKLELFAPYLPLHFAPPGLAGTEFIVIGEV